ncbi:hypothetical protein [Streptomyces sp. Je 1-369]|uniref:hypothetical protein n=1 Tax=Streptomyces sp. Je 1-369 TaxID=2966192 RepID=UPI002285D60E|nr:hypothetical protein [Streptomyces sp. Je 1-369]WAL93931.1 hypothetical protein NOO62_05130 [Streptomyces sp. Je 1-369]
MATGPEHYLEAERILATCTTDSGALVLDDGTAEVLAAAQVRATLALAAATAMGAPLDGEADSGLPHRDAQAWWDVAGVKPPKRGDAG